jgi:hypothetical protein
VSIIVVMSYSNVSLCVKKYRYDIIDTFIIHVYRDDIVGDTNDDMAGDVDR